MTTKKYLKINLFLTLAGMAFAGYMTSVKLFSGACAFGESCPTIFGLPTCAYGFVIFTVMFSVTVCALIKKRFDQSPIKKILGLSGFGILFSGYFVVPEFLSVLSGARYLLGLPTCAYGLVFYAVIFVMALVAWKQSQR